MFIAAYVKEESSFCKGGMFVSFLCEYFPSESRITQIAQISRILKFFYLTVFSLVGATSV